MTEQIALPMDQDSPSTALWSGIAALSLSVFALVMAEFLPPSVLTPMAADLGISLGAAGQAVTATAVIAAVAALLVPVATRRWDRKRVLIGLMIALSLSNLLTATATGLVTLLTARLLLGVALGGFWSMVAATAMRLVPMSVLGRAMAIVFTGVTMATVLAAPVGAYIGDLLGWRTAFWLAGGVGLAALLGVLVTLPRLPARGSADLAGLVEVARRPQVLWALIAVLLIISGHFAAFTYVRPVLEQVTGLGISAITLALFVFGGAGFLGNLAGGLLSGRDPKLSVIVGAMAMATALAAVLILGASVLVTTAALGLWGMGFAMLPVGFQAWVATETTDKAELGGGLLTATFQVAIAGGAIFGGLLVDRFTILAAPAYCVTVAIAGLALVALRLNIARRSQASPVACRAT
ncbi:MFS transporter [Brevundimonas faecalis]|uniref:MFS family arabinose efflux permease n=1 Tax=Brevundimonas faecalis TaxID=947378 RepID=A0ABV2R7W0_9CAUL